MKIDIREPIEIDSFYMDFSEPEVEEEDARLSDTDTNINEEDKNT